jgi:hypothetical protein
MLFFINKIENRVHIFSCNMERETKGYVNCNMEDPCLFDEDREAAEEYASRVKEEDLVEAIEYFEEEEAEIEDLLAQDYHRQLHTEETLAEYTMAIRRIRDIIFYLRKRYYDGPEEDDGMEDITETLSNNLKIEVK